MLLDHLINKFMEIKRLQEAPVYDHNLAEDILSLAKDEDITPENIDEFIDSNTEVRNAILYGNSIICQQPIIILLAYYLENYPYYLKEKWDIDYDVYNSVCTSLGYAPDR